MSTNNLNSLKEKLETLSSQVEKTESIHRTKLREAIAKVLKAKSLPERTTIEAPTLNKVVITSDDEPVVELNYGNGVVTPHISANNLNALYVIGKTFSGAFAAQDLVDAFVNTANEFLEAVQDDKHEIQAVKKHISSYTVAEQLECTKDIVARLLEAVGKPEIINVPTPTHLQYKYGQFLLGVSSFTVHYQSGKTWVLNAIHDGTRTYNTSTLFENEVKTTRVGVSEKYLLDFLVRGFNV